jgi:ABC-type anion transport system duplicated permease subunit
MFNRNKQKYTFYNSIVSLENLLVSYQIVAKNLFFSSFHRQALDYRK